MSLYFQGVSFLRHQVRAGNQHSIHSPFLFGLYNKVFSNPVFIPKKTHKAVAAIEKERKRLLADPALISIKDLGAGSRVSRQSTRAVSSLARSGLMSPHWALSLHRMADALQISSVLELGTSLGITTAYLAMVPSVKKVVTMDGCTESLAVAKAVWGNLGLVNITSVEGKIEDHLGKVLEEHQPQMIILDANHQYEAVLNYFRMAKPYLTEDSVVVLDDLYWSKSMAQAWSEIRSDDSVRQSLDFFWQGWLFFRPGQAPERFVLRG